MIGITGSFGKSTTKEILHLILASKFKTYAIPKNVNTDIGFAETILSNLGPLADVFIVEMGAYKRGEIKAICDIAPPDIAVITAISEQHLSLFETIENTLKAKYEIVENSKKNVIIVLNGDNDLVLRIAGKSAKKEIMYSVKRELDVWASDIKSKKDRVVFNVHHGADKQRFEVRMFGEHNVSNILAATSVALALGMKLSEIADALKKGSERRQIGRISLKRSKFGYRVIDDSHNSNSAGFSASLDYLDNLKAKKKILVTIGMIGLGEKQNEVYDRLSKKIVKICDSLVTSDERLVQYVRKYNENFNVIFDKGVNKQLKYLKNDVGKGDVVLFEGPNLRLTQDIIK